VDCSRPFTQPTLLPLHDRQGHVWDRYGKDMPEHSFEPIRGTLERFTFSSINLENELGDPVEREVVVHIPPNAEGSLPCIIYLAPFTGTGFARANWQAFSETLPQRHERLVKEGKMGPAILVMPDTFTSLGGNQFIDSSIMGDWGTWLSQDLCEELNTRYQINGFGLVGKSSGGYGSLVRGMLDDCWGAVACHSGDCGFDTMFSADLLSCATAAKIAGGTMNLFESLKNKSKLSGNDFHHLMIIAMAASYDDSFELPIDLESGEIIEERWNNWLSWDPLRMIEDLQDLPPVWIDVGNADQYHIQYGLRCLHNRMELLEIAHEWEEFEGTHSGIDHRLDLSLPWMYGSLTSSKKL